MYPISRLALTPGQQVEVEAERIADVLASKPDHKLQVGTEFEVRDHVN